MVLHQNRQRKQHCPVSLLVTSIMFHLKINLFNAFIYVLFRLGHLHFGPETCHGLEGAPSGLSQRKTELRTKPGPRPVFLGPSYMEGRTKRVVDKILKDNEKAKLERLGPRAAGRFRGSGRVLEGVVRV